jgi:beta-phosphoglucomutase-like phosphatase (HAD superfamily)
MKIGAIFDFDGVLFDSEKLHEASWNELAKKERKPISRAIFLKGFGVKNDLFIREMLKWSHDEKEIQRIIHDKESIFWGKVEGEGIHPIQSTLDLVKRLHAAKVPCGVGTSAMKRNIDIVFLKYPEIKALFQAFVTADDVQHGKPHPEVFLKCAQKLSVDPTHCVVFEDAPLGIEAAKSGGMKAVALTTTFSEKELLPSKPDRIVKSLQALSLQDLEKLFGSN